MRIKEGFVLRDICGVKAVMAHGAVPVDFNKIIALNESAAWLWQQIEGIPFEASTLAALLKEHYDVDEATARCDAEELLAAWQEAGIVQE